MKDRRWRIGELAAATGMTVRGLRHYEDIGLLPPATRTEGRQRVYDGHVLQRLYRVCALRELGLELSQIARALDDAPSPLGDLLRAHHTKVTRELERLDRLRALLDHACASVERGDDPDLLATLEAMSAVSRRAAESPAPAPEREAAWRVLGEALRAHMNAGAPIDDPTVMALAREARTRIQDFARGEPATLDALAHLRVHAPPVALAGWDPPLMRYLHLALEHLSRTEDPCHTK